MSWSAVAKKEFRDAIRSWWLIGLTLLFVVVAGGFAYLFQAAPDLSTDPGTNAAATSVLLGTPAGAVTFVAALIGLVIGHKRAVADRDAASLKLLLGFPHTRRDVAL